MQKLSVLLTFLFVNIAAGYYIPRQVSGTQFITGPCTSDADCRDGCCGFNTGKCAGPVVALERDGGCGFGDAQPNDNAARALGFTGGITSAANPPAGAANNAADSAAAGAAPARGTQFITGPCTSDADCADGCCGFNTGKCAGPVVALERDGGCGFGDAQPNDNAARALGFTGGITSTANPPAAAAANNAADSSAAGADAPAVAPGTQFITGPCTSDADCADGCCGFNTGKCAGPIVALERDGGCGFGDPQPNDNAARRLRGQ